MQKGGIKINIKKVSKNVYVVMGLRGCNIGFLVTTSGIVMIDTPQKPTPIVSHMALLMVAAK